MKNFMNLEMFYAAACLVYIISGLSFVVIYAGHICVARLMKVLTAIIRLQTNHFFLSAVSFNSLYLLQPSDEGTWVYIRIFEYSITPWGFHCTMQIFSYITNTTFNFECLWSNSSYCILFIPSFGFCLAMEICWFNIRHSDMG